MTYMYDYSVQHAPLPHKFTGKERDPESGLDNFEARYYGSSLGRFMSPDPDNAGADLLAPQSWNAYSYVLNNPLNAISAEVKQRFALCAGARLTLRSAQSQ
jgi:RHS repeat-associated protein